MKKILIIGKLNSMLKDIGDHLHRYFSVQYCSENTNQALGMIKVVEPSLVIISLVGLFDMDKNLYLSLSDEFASLPVITIGTESEKKQIPAYCTEPQFSHLIRPIDNSDVLEEVCRRLMLDRKKLIHKAVVTDEAKKTVLVVDDNAAVLRSIKAMLEEKYNVMLANSGMQALKSMGKKHPDVILLDYEMPVCDGRQTLEMIRADEEISDIPVIFLTGVNSREHIEAVIRLKPAGYLLKPAVADKIIANIEKALAQKEQNEVI